MSIVNDARRHFGSRWHSDIRVLGRDAYIEKLNELQNEINHLQQCCNRLRMADKREPARGDVGGDIKIVSERVEAEILALHGWTVSLVETVFVLVSLESGEESELRKLWKSNL